MPCTVNLSELFSQGLIWTAEPASSGSAQRKIIEYVFTTGPAHTSNSYSKDTQQLKAACPLGLELIDSVLPAAGLPFGATHEWFVDIKNEQHNFPQYNFPPCSFLALLCGNALKLNPSKFVIWIGKEIWPSPFVLQMPISKDGTGKNGTRRLISNCIFVNPPNQKLLLWALETALRSNAVAAVVASPKNLRFALSQRLNMAAKTGGALALIVRTFKESVLPSAATSRWLIRPDLCEDFDPHFKLGLLKYKGAKPAQSEWTVAIRSDGVKNEEFSLYIPPPKSSSLDKLRTQNLAAGGSG